MTEHTGLPVAGYNAQPDHKVKLVNHFKQEEERLLRTLDTFKTGQGSLVLRDQFNPFNAIAYPLTEGFADPRWLAIARTKFEEAFMALNRSIFQPSRVILPEDAA